MSAGKRIEGRSPVYQNGFPADKREFRSAQGCIFQPEQTEKNRQQINHAMSGKTFGQVAVEILVDIIVDCFGKGLPALPVADQFQVVLGIFFLVNVALKAASFFSTPSRRRMVMDNRPVSTAMTMTCRQGGPAGTAGAG